jgi:hypothetical protein
MTVGAAREGQLIGVLLVPVESELELPSIFEVLKNFYSRSYSNSQILSIPKLHNAFLHVWPSICVWEIRKRSSSILPAASMAKLSSKVAGTHQITFLQKMSESGSTLDIGQVICMPILKNSFFPQKPQRGFKYSFKKSNGI